MRNEGAKEARRIIKRFHECINSPRVVPSQCYRPSSQTYVLVNYVNQITGLYLSKNYDLLPIFLQRAHEQLAVINPERVSEPYRQLVISYLSHVARFILEFGCLADDDTSGKLQIPAALLHGDLSPPPDDLFVDHEF